MLGYATVGSINFAASKAFFDAALGALGMAPAHDYGDWVGYCDPHQKDNIQAQTIWLTKTPHNGQAATAGNGSMVGFQAQSTAQVDAFYAAAMANGGSSEGAPGLREAYGPGFYVAYVRDPMGNKFSCVHRS
jgi:catechol 2,3-dioxygenase-like lactoylglutathione lyase family enzyme